MYSVVTKRVSEIKPDPNQPRKIFDTDSIKELAQSLKLHGVIKNIEIDEKNFIITGENRWRAAKLAGITEIPCRVLTLTKEDRYLRQLAENLMVAEMNPIDIAKAIRTLQNNGKPLHQISAMLGKHYSWAGRSVQILELPKALQNKFVKAAPAQRSINAWHAAKSLEEEGKLPKGTAEAFAKKIIDANAEPVRQLSAALQANPGSVKKLLAIDISKKRPTIKILEEIARVAPTAVQQTGQTAYLGRITLYSIRGLMTKVKNSSPSSFGLEERKIRKEIKELRDHIDRWLDRD